MEAKVMGRFLQEERKKCQISRKQLAARLGVRVETVVLWERGVKIPESKHLPNLANLLGVSVGEIFAGERIVRRTPEKTDQIILEAMEYAKERSGRHVDTVLLGLGAFFLFVPLFLSEITDTILYHMVGLALILAAVVRICGRHRKEAFTRRQRRAYVYALLCQTAALALEILPYGVALLFSLGTKEDVRRTFSYFQQASAENPFYTLTGVLTVVLVLMSSACFMGSRGHPRLRSPILACSVAALVLSIMPAVIGGASFLTTTGICVSALLLSSVILQASALRACP